MPSRRAFLGAAVLATVTSGCASTADVLGVRPVVRVAVSWSAAELRAFRSVLGSLKLNDYRVDPIPLGDEIATAFDSGTARRPDVVMLPQPGLVKTHLAELKPLPDNVVPRPWPYGRIWRDMLFHKDNQKECPKNDPAEPIEYNPEYKCYGIPFKTAHKSTVWYRKSALNNEPPPQSWNEWIKLNRTLATRDSNPITPLALPAADGWMLTDFFENVLLGSAPDVYKKLTDSCPQTRWSLSVEPAEPAVRTALERLGEMWAIPLNGGVNRTLVQQFPDAVVEVFGYQRAAMVVAPDFAEPLVRRLTRDTPGDFGIFSFPAIGAEPPSADANPLHPDCALPPAVDRPPLVVGGDVAVLLAGASPEAEDLIRRLANPETARPWIRHGGFLAAHADTPLTDYSCELMALAKQLNDSKRSIEFDLSDQLGPLGGSGGLWRVLQDFLAQVGGRGDQADLEGAVNTAIAELQKLELEG